MTRRSLFKGLFAAIMAGGAAKTVVAATKGALPTFLTRPPLTIGSILTSSFPDIKNYALMNGRWAAEDLMRATDSGRIMFRSIGPCIIDAQTGVHHEPEEISIPIVWSKRDDEKNRSENDKIEMVASLAQNAIDSMEDVFREKLGDGRACVSKEYHHNLGVVGEYHHGEENQFYLVKLYTAAAFLPKQRS